MTVTEVRRADQQLLDTVAALVDELDDVPTGRVLRCFSRAVRHLRRHGCPPDRLAAEAEWLTREMLAGRLGLGAGDADAAQYPVPGPRSS
jgi:hypothetical protein